jgi:anti-sigma B factor antagonist
MGPVPAFRASVDTRNGVARIALTGELDLATVTVLEGHLAPLGRAGVADILLDLRDLVFTDTTGIHAFHRAGDRVSLGGRRLILVGATPPVRHVFDLTGMQSLLDDRNAAGVLARFTGGRTAPEAESSIDEAADA